MKTIIFIFHHSLILIKFRTNMLFIIMILGPFFESISHCHQSQVLLPPGVWLVIALFSLIPTWSLYIPSLYQHYHKNNLYRSIIILQYTVLGDVLGFLYQWILTLYGVKNFNETLASGKLFFSKYSGVGQFGSGWGLGRRLGRLISKNIYIFLINC